MTEDKLLSYLGPTLLFCLGIFFLVFVLRTIAEAIRPSLATNHLWREKFLKVFPIILGAGVALAAQRYPLPLGLQSNSARFLFGLVTGGMSGWLYKIVKAQIKKKFDVNISVPPSRSGAKVTVEVPPHDKTPEDPHGPP